MFSLFKPVLAFYLALLTVVNAQTCATTFTKVGCYTADAYTVTQLVLPPVILADLGFVVDEAAGIGAVLPNVTPFSLENCFAACGSATYIAVYPGVTANDNPVCVCMRSFSPISQQTLANNAATLGISTATCNTPCVGNNLETCGRQAYNLPTNGFTIALPLNGQIRLVNVYQVNLCPVAPPASIPCSALTNVGCYLGQTLGTVGGIASLPGLPDILQTSGLIVASSTDPAIASSAQTCAAYCGSSVGYVIVVPNPATCLCTNQLPSVGILQGIGLNLGIANLCANACVQSSGVCAGVTLDLFGIPLANVQLANAFAVNPAAVSASGCISSSTVLSTTVSSASVASTSSASVARTSSASSASTSSASVASTSSAASASTSSASLTTISTVSQSSTRSAISSTSSAPASCAAVAYLGCYLGSTNDLGLLEGNFLINTITYPNTLNESPEACAIQCPTANVVVMVPGSCYCLSQLDPLAASLQLDALGLGLQALCNSPCPGNPAESCGALTAQIPILGLTIDLATIYSVTRSPALCPPASSFSSSIQSSSSLSSSSQSSSASSSSSISIITPTQSSSQSSSAGTTTAVTQSSTQSSAASSTASTQFSSQSSAASSTVLTQSSSQSPAASSSGPSQSISQSQSSTQSSASSAAPSQSSSQSSSISGASASQSSSQSSPASSSVLSQSSTQSQISSQSSASTSGSASASASSSSLPSTITSITSTLAAATSTISSTASTCVPSLTPTCPGSGILPPFFNLVLTSATNCGSQDYFGANTFSNQSSLDIALTAKVSAFVWSYIGGNQFFVTGTSRSGPIQGIYTPSDLGVPSQGILPIYFVTQTQLAVMAAVSFNVQFNDDCSISFEYPNQTFAKDKRATPTSADQSFLYVCRGPLFRTTFFYLGDSAVAPNGCVQVILSYEEVPQPTPLSSSASATASSITRSVNTQAQSTGTLGTFTFTYSPPYDPYSTVGPYNPYPTDEPYNPHPTNEPYNPYPTGEPYNSYPTDEPYNPYPSGEPYDPYATGELYNPHPTGEPYPAGDPYYPYPVYTTSVVYATTVYTVTKCPVWVKDCPYGQVTTKTLSSYTTVCTVDAEPTGYGSGGTYENGSGHPESGSGYPVGSEYPKGSSGYPAGSSYPEGNAGYPEGGASYPEGSSGYPEGGASYPEGSSGYPEGGASYPEGSSGYPEGGAGYPEGSSGYPEGEAGYPEGSNIVPYTTSVVYGTIVYTITQCPATITDCPVGHITTEITSYTTVCPVEAAETDNSYPAGPAQTYSPAGAPYAPFNQTYAASSPTGTQAAGHSAEPSSSYVIQSSAVKNRMWIVGVVLGLLSVVMIL